MLKSKTQLSAIDFLVTRPGKVSIATLDVCGIAGLLTCSSDKYPFQGLHIPIVSSPDHAHKD
eukprot:2755939-Amphidinium_carterae.1